MPFPNEHSCRLRQPAPSGSQTGRITRRSKTYKRDYDVIRQKYPRTGWDEQAFRYPRTTWPVSEARAHCKSHKGISFEPAKPKKADEKSKPYLHECACGWWIASSRETLDTACPWCNDRLGLVLDPDECNLDDRRFRALGDEPEGDRLNSPAAFRKTRGLEQGVDREGGSAGAGLISGFSVITRGEAKGWGYWIDDVMVQQVVDAGNERAPRVKSRYTHPGISSDGLGKLLGRVVNFRKVGDQGYADLDFVASAHKTPGGDRASYVMDMTEESPDLLASSIVFYRDRGAMQEFKGKHSDAEGNFKSPDRKNVRNLPHYRLKSLEAVDIVDEPAANPRGFFSSPLADLDAGLDYALGITDEAPAKALLDRVNPERARRFVTGYLARRGLSLTRKGEPDGPASQTERTDEMPDIQDLTAEQLEAGNPKLVGQLKAEGAQEEAAKATAEAAASTDEVSELIAAKDAAAQCERDRFKALQDKWPERPKFVAEQFAAGATLEEAQAAFRDVQLAELKAENAELKTQVEGASPVEFRGEPVDKSHLAQAVEYQAAHGGEANCKIIDALKATAPRR